MNRVMTLATVPSESTTEQSLLTLCYSDRVVSSSILCEGFKELLEEWKDHVHVFCPPNDQGAGLS